MWKPAQVRMDDAHERSDANTGFLCRRWACPPAMSLDCQLRFAEESWIEVRAIRSSPNMQQCIQPTTSQARQKPLDRGLRAVTESRALMRTSSYMVDAHDAHDE